MVLSWLPAFLGANVFHVKRSMRGMNATTDALLDLLLGCRSKQQNRAKRPVKSKNTKSHVSSARPAQSYLELREKPKNDDDKSVQNLRFVNDLKSPDLYAAVDF